MNIPMYSALSMLVYGKALYKNIIIIIMIQKAGFSYSTFLVILPLPLN